MILKKTAAGLLILTMAVTGAACSSKNSTSSPSPAATATSTVAPQASAVSQDTTNMQGYIAARMAREKVDYLFTEAKSADGAFVLNPIAATDKETAKKFLANYFDTSMLDTLTNYYVTDTKAGSAFLTNTKSYFKSNLLDTKKEDIVFDKANTADLVKFTTKDGVTYTTKKVNDKFLVSAVE